MKQNGKSERVFRELRELAERIFPEMRHEEGRFKTGVCTLHGKRTLILNNRQTIDEKIAALASAIAHCDTDDIFMKPVVRAEVERYAHVTENSSD